MAAHPCAAEPLNLFRGSLTLHCYFSVAERDPGEDCETVYRMDAVVELTGMYLQRVLQASPGSRSHTKQM